MKRILVLITLILALILCITSCDLLKPSDPSPEHTHEFGEWFITENASCGKSGVKVRCCSCGEKQSEAIPSLSHNVVIDEAVASTCTTTGLTEGQHCSICNEVLVSQIIVDALGHTEMVDEAVAPTCTATGLTEGKHCSVCNEVIVAQIEMPKVSHSYDDKYDESCNVCGFIRDADCAHTNVSTQPEKSATCTQPGLTEGKVCTDCEEILVPQTVIDSLGHTEVIDDAKAPTCTETGLTEGKHCSVCDEVIVAQTVIDSLGHNVVGHYCTECNELFASEGLEFTLNDDELSYSVTGIGKCTDTDIAIPSTYEGLPVTAIGNSAFFFCTDITNVLIPDSITTIENHAFSYCFSLVSINVPYSVVNIEYVPFDSCTNLTAIIVDDDNAYYKSIDGNLYSEDGTVLMQYAVGKTDTAFVIPDSVTTVYDYAFKDCYHLSEIELPDTVRSIGFSAFTNCTKLTSITVPNGVTSIGYQAFYGCESLVSVSISSSVSNIGSEAFNMCESLTNINVDANNDVYQSIDGNLYTIDGTRLIQYAIGKQDYIFNIPNGVVIIGEDAFNWCDALMTVVIPDSVTTIEENAFYNCASLVTLVVGKDVTSIATTAFEACSNLMEVYYTGTEDEWNSISIDTCNDPITDATRYYYSVSEPHVEGNFWHYVDDEIVVWPAVAPLYTRDGDYIYFGEYPQTIKADDVTITATQDSRGYYLGSDGNYYAAVTATPYKSGYTFSNNAMVVSGTVYYFKVEPIRWRILSTDGETALILCDSIIANIAYDAYNNGNYSNNYKNSDIRAWLNETFYETAFTALQQEIIITTTVDNSVYSTGYSSNPYACEDTEDKVFLLSYREVTNSAYGFSTDRYAYDTARRMLTSDYSRATGVCMSTSSDYYGNGRWWLRSPGNDRSDYARCVYYDGDVSSYGFVDYSNFGVVAALQIRL